MFELLYSSGLRLGELVALNVDDGRLDLRQGEVTVTGKGSKTRTVPVGAKAREALAAWLAARAGGARGKGALRRRAGQADRARHGRLAPQAVGAPARPA